MSTQSHHHEHEEADQDERKRLEAAQRIQKLWKQRHNRAQEQYLTSDVRWKEAATHAKLKVDREAMDDGKNHPRERWKRAAFFVTQLRDGNSMLKPEKNEQDVPEDVKKHLETQHWLELVDGKHRYGSNLKYYHKRWLDEDTQDNFFRWLDQGEGKSLSLDECSREQLEKERIQYLSAEQRLNYLAIIDNKGKLRWARNNELVDTTPSHWKDSGNGGGIIPDDLPERPAQSRRAFDSASSSSLSSSSGSVNSDNAMHYLDPPKGKYPWTRAFRRYFTPKGVFNRLLRKTVQRNTWIWVTDRHC